MSAFPDFEDWLLRQDYADHTRGGYLADLRHFAAWFETRTGEAPAPDSLTARDLRAYREHLLESGRAVSTVNRRMDALRAWLGWAQRRGLRTDNPARALRRLKQNRPGSVRWLDGRQQAALLQAVERDVQMARSRYPVRQVTRQRDAAMLLAFLYTGLRVSELTALRMDDLTLEPHRGELLVRAGKGSKQRRVPLNAAARQALREWLDVRPDTGGEYLFPPLEHNVRDRRLSSRAVQRVVRRFGEQASLPDVTPQVLRPPFAKNLVDAGVSLEMVAVLLGHSNLNPIRVYIAPSQQDLAQAVEGIVQNEP